MIKSKEYTANPLLDELVDVMGRDYYEEKWRSLSPLSKFWYALRGQNPGGRKGAPPLRELGGK